MPMPKDEESFDSDLDIDKDNRSPKAIQKFISSLKQHKIETAPDWKLLIGVLERDCHKTSEISGLQSFGFQQINE